MTGDEDSDKREKNQDKEELHIYMYRKNKTSEEPNVHKMPPSMPARCQQMSPCQSAGCFQMLLHMHWHEESNSPHGPKRAEGISKIRK